MTNSIKSKRYFVKLIPAVIWYALFLVFGNFFNENTRIYVSLIFFLGLSIYFYVLGNFKFRKWGQALKGGKKFWFPVLFTVLGTGAATVLGLGSSLLFPNADTGLGIYKITTPVALVAFAFTTIILPPISDEVFFRKAIIAFDSKAVVLLSSAVSVLLYAGEHSALPLGFLQAALWALPYTIAYVKTKNIYISMTAHFICNLAFNGVTVVVVVVSFI